MFFNQQNLSTINDSSTKNISAWESLITDLSEADFDDDDCNNSNSSSSNGSKYYDYFPARTTTTSSRKNSSTAHPGSSSNSGPLQGHHDNGDYLTNKSDDHATNTSAASTTTQTTTTSTSSSSLLESPSPLKDWIAYHSLKYPPHVNHMGRKMKDVYVEHCARIALFLARSLGGQQQQMMTEEEENDEENATSSAKNDVIPLQEVEDIIIDNVQVMHHIENEEMILEGANIILSSTTTTTNHYRNNGETHPTERQQVLALGMILYELFTQGKPPPIWIQQSLQSRNDGNVLSFGASLRISDEKEEEEEEDAFLRGGRRRKLNDDTTTTTMDQDEDDTDFIRKQRRRFDDKQSIPTLLKLAGVPSSISRLISDMLSNRHDVDFGGLFQYDKSVSRLEDVVMDLEQMLSRPKEFLYDTIRLSAKPIVRDELYSRVGELERGMELAERAWKGGDVGEIGEEVEVGDYELSLKQEVLVVSGLPGSGKSSFVNKLIAQLTSNGWESLHCKFDQFGRRQPLSTIASAFDRLFSSLLSAENESEIDGNDTLRDIRASLSNSFDEESFSIFFQLIPNLRRVMENDDDNSTEMQLTEYIDEFDESAMIPSKLLVQNLFCELLKAISTFRDNPMLLFLDDLHWADLASLELITYLMDEMGASITGKGTNVLIVGTVRTDEVEKSSELADFLQQIKSSYNVTVTEMALQDLSPLDVNLMISESLCYSQRLTRSLADIVHQKTTGNPFFVKEFLNDLNIENLLVYSFSERKWEWDEDLIESRTISDGVAEILSRKMLRLPTDQLSALVMLSFFGSEVSLEVLALVKSSFGDANITSTLESVAKARFVESSDEKYRFVHDMILHAAQEAVDEETRMIMMKNLLQSLLTSGCRDDTVLFIIVDLISRVGANRVHDPESRLLYAQLNLTAAEKATKATDYASASTCTQCGISYLSVGHWDENYKLSLDLYSQSALVEWALGNTEQMMKSLDEVFNNANCFEDTLRAAHVKLGYLRMTGSCLSEAFAYGFQILDRLGETFPAEPQIGMVIQEMLGTKQLLLGSLNASALRSLPKMTNPKKKEAMAFLEEILICSYQSQSIYFFLIACRMIHITSQYGLSKYSCEGLGSVALGLVTLFGDFTEGYAISKTSLSIASSDKRVLYSIMVTAYGMINIWKEPIQAILPQLKDVHDMSLKYGLIDVSLAAGMLHAYRAFFTGSLLKPLSTEVELFMRNNLERHKRQLMHLSLLPVFNGISCLKGPNVGEFIQEEHLAEALKHKEGTVCECLLAIKMMCSFIFRRYDEIKSTARQYLELFERQREASAQFINIYRLFYGGLISLHFYRESRDQFWMDRAAHAIEMMELWTAESVWNFENKLLLLQAERHYAFGEMDNAAEKYKLAKESSKKHRFVHEEALTCELAAAFHEKAGNADLVAELIDSAVELYRTWGADGKVSLLQLSTSTN